MNTLCLRGLIKCYILAQCVLLEVEKELGKKGKKVTLGSIQQAPELPTKTRTLRKNMDNRDGDSPGETLCLIPLLLQLIAKVLNLLYILIQQKVNTLKG